MAQKLTAEVFRVKNVRGIPDMEVRPGSGIIISGKNGAGKTSLLAGMEEVFSGGSNPNLIRVGADKAEIYAQFTDGVEAWLTVKKDGTDRKVKHPKTGDVRKAQSYLSALLDLAAADYFQFTQLPKDKRREAFLRLVPKALTADQLNAATGLNFDADQVKKDGHALVTLSRVRAELTKAAEASLEQAGTLRENANERKKELPVEEKDYAAEIAKLEAEKSSLAESQEDQKKALGATMRSAQQKAVENADEFIKGISAERDAEVEALQKRIEEVRAQAQATIDAAIEERDAIVDEAERKHNEEVEKLNATWTPSLERLAGEIERAKTLKEVQDRAAGTRQTIIEDLAKADALEAKGKEYSSALEKLVDLEAEVAKDIPIEGVSIRNGDIYVNNVDWDGLNQAQKMILGLELKALDSDGGKAGLCFMDHGESLDSENRSKVIARAKELGITLVMAVVTDEEELTVKAV